MTIEIKGKLLNLLPEATYGNFTVKNAWLGIDQDTQHPQTIEISLSGKVLNVLDNVKIGTEIEASVNLAGKIVKDKCYNSLRCWKVKINGEQKQPIVKNETNAPVLNDMVDKRDHDVDVPDDLPF